MVQQAERSKYPGYRGDPWAGATSESFPVEDERGGGYGGGLMGAGTPKPTTPVVPPGQTPVTVNPGHPLTPPVTTPAGPSTPVTPPTTVQPPVTPPVPGPSGNWQDNIIRPPGQSMPLPPVVPSSPHIPPSQALPPMPTGGGAVNMPPPSQAISYEPGAPIGTNPYAGAGPSTLGTGSAGVGDFRGAYAEGDRGAATRTVQDDELSGHQLDQLIKGDSQYIQNARIGARAQAAERGMLMSSIGVGAAQRASIDAAQPFAMQQADTYGRTASENMAASNADALADQGQFRDMAARDIQLRAQMEDAALGRQFQSGLANSEQQWRSGEAGLDRSLTQSESAANRNFQSGERAAGQNWQSGESAYDRAWKSGETALDRYQQSSERIGQQNWQSGESAYDRAWRGDQQAMDRYQQTSERMGQQDWQSGETAYDRAWREYQQGLERAQQTNERLGGQDFNRDMSEQEQRWRSGEAGLDRNYNADQAAKSRDEARYGAYFNSVANREAQVATVLNGIYSNPNLTPQQQQAAADNARAVLGGIHDGYNATMANGIPPIFANPYPMTFEQPPPAP